MPLDSTHCGRPRRLAFFVSVAILSFFQASERGDQAATAAWPCMAARRRRHEAHCPPATGGGNEIRASPGPSCAAAAAAGALASSGPAWIPGAIINAWVEPGAAAATAHPCCAPTPPFPPALLQAALAGGVLDAPAPIPSGGTLFSHHRSTPQGPFHLAPPPPSHTRPHPRGFPRRAAAKAAAAAATATTTAAAQLGSKFSVVITVPGVKKAPTSAAKAQGVAAIRSTAAKYRE